MKADLTPTSLTCEMLHAPLGLTVTEPRFGWIVESEKRDQVQSAYRILVSDTVETLCADQGTLWDSGRVTTRKTAHIPYAGRPLHSDQRCFWKVRVWDGDGRSSAYSAAAVWQMGLLTLDEWVGVWIGINSQPEPELDMNPGVMLRRDFAVAKPVVRATLYATAKGIYRPRLNGQRVGDIELAPGWTDYSKRHQVQAYDVTRIVQLGDNVLGILLGDGWYSGYLGFQQLRAYYGSHPRALAQLIVHHLDGTVTVVATDEAWTAALGPILYSDIQMGEHYDARRELPGWDVAEYDDATWQPVIAEPLDPQVILEGQRDQPIRVNEEIHPLEITQPTPDTYIFDIGQNFAGKVCLSVSGEPGTAVRLRYGELLEPDGSLHTANLRSARATDTYVLRGGNTEVYSPHFTYHGFRYVEVTGYPGSPTHQSVIGQVMHNAMPETGTFKCSNPMVNQLWRNILWSQRSNFLSVPTDCPQRDERLGWTGDAQIFCRTASFNMDVAAFFTKWMLDLTDAQTSDGAFTDVAPQIKGLSKGAPAWGDAGIIIPWTLYRVYGDTTLLERNYEAMKAWMRYIGEANPLHLRTKRLHNSYADWVSLERGTSAEQIATAYWARIARMMAEIAAALGHENDAEYYAETYAEIRQTYIAAYVHPDGAIETDTQTAYVLALDNDLLPEALRPAAAERLARIIEHHNDHLATGFLGTPALCFVLGENGYLDLAYRLLTQETYPSWGYMIKNGATTMWERWDAYTHAEGIHNPGMNSFNHYAYGAIGEWLYRVVAGINVGQPGYGHSLLRPRPGGGLDYASATYRSVHGTLHCGWRRSDDGLHVDVTVPANTTATLELPADNPHTVQEGDGPASEAEGVQFVRYARGKVVFGLASGQFRFLVPRT